MKRKTESKKSEKNIYEKEKNIRKGKRIGVMKNTREGMEREGIDRENIYRQLPSNMEHFSLT